MKNVSKQALTLLRDVPKQALTLLRDVPKQALTLLHDVSKQVLTLLHDAVVGFLPRPVTSASGGFQANPVDNRDVPTMVADKLLLL